ncbi:hypothetical protein ILUMI_08120 [Ignelater luminosus]|uniref:Rab-GAP TBC domain-containing protein n=1 Tax=Ignelater luminosus TaxID=2038154 RepID=A0A8K0D270_IGNLU|nr:hypothetical protein ILUMI_08120 [Ignelater luminosus]
MKGQISTQIVKILFSQDGVILVDAPPAYQNCVNKTGKMLITEYEKKSMIYVEWKIKNELITSETEDKEWSLVDVMQQESGSDDAKDDEYLDCLKLHLKNIKQVKIINPNERVELMEVGRTWLFDFRSGNFSEFVIDVTAMLNTMKEFYPEVAPTDYLSSFINLIPNFVSTLTGIVYSEWNPEQGDVKRSLSKYKREGFPNLPQREICERGEPLSLAQWQSFKNSEGKIYNVDVLKKIIFKGGLSIEIRKEVWMYLLKYNKWEYPSDQQEEWISKCRDDYYAMKSIWKNIKPDVKDTRFKKCHDSVWKDVLRTDRDLAYYSGSDNPNLEKLFNILMTYCAVYNSHLGYVQGMDTLLSPILYLLDNEADAFWCFVGFMNRTSPNFEKSQTYMRMQLYNTINLLTFLQPEFVEYLKKKGCDHLGFCFRWLLVWFKRELSMENVINLWEVLWTGLPCENFHLLICVSLLESQQAMFMENDYGPEEILQHIHNMRDTIDVAATLNSAEAIYNQIVSSEYLPESIIAALCLPRNKFISKPE